MFDRRPAPERSPEEKLRRSEEARRLLAEPLLAEAFDALRSETLAALLACKPTDDLARFRLAEALKLLARIESHLQLILETPRVQQAASAAARALRHA